MKPNFLTIHNYFRERDRGLLLVLIAAVCVVYLPFLGNPFVFDDRNMLNGPFIAYFSHSPVFDLRWFPYVSMGWTARLFSDELPHPFRLANVLLHAANVILLFHLLRLLLRTVIRDQSSSSSITWGAWLGAMVFAVHPVAVYAAGYVVQHSILMATLFALLMQWTYLRALLSGQTRWLLLAVLAYFLACFSKEHSILMPAVLAAMTLLLRKQNLVSKRALGLAWSAFVIVALVVLRQKGMFGGAPESALKVFSEASEPMAAAMLEQQSVAGSGAEVHLLSAMTQAGMFFKYLLLWFVPNTAWMSIDMREAFVSSLNSWQGWIGVGGFVIYGLVAFRLLLKGGVSGLVGLALLYSWLQFFTEFSSIRVQEPFVLYRSYLWMPGMMMLIPLLLVKLPQRRTLVILGCVVTLLTPLAWNRLWVFSDNYRLWNDAALLLKNEREAGADRIYYNRGQALLAAQKWDDAAKDFERTAAISPKLEPVRYLLGVAYSSSGRFQEALVQFDVAITIKDDDAQVYFVKGLTLKRLHRDKEAMQDMEKSCRLKNVTACMIVSMSKKRRN